MGISLKKKLFFLVFCLASVLQGMYSTYFVSILTTIERIYQIQSKTAGAIISATEVGQILGSLLVAYYGGRGNKPRWIASCMTLTAIAAMISTTPHFLNSSLQTSNSHAKSLVNQNTSNDAMPTGTHSFNSTPPAITPSSLHNLLVNPAQDQLCHMPNPADPTVLNSTFSINPMASRQLEQTSRGVDIISSHLDTATLHHNHNKTNRSLPSLIIFFICLLAIGFGSTAITTLGIPFIDDIVSKEESPLYLGLSIGLKILGPALGFFLGSFCIRLNPELLHSMFSSTAETAELISTHQDGAWWLGPMLISLPLLLLAIPMYYLSRLIARKEPTNTSDLDGITYQAAEDHDIGGSRDFQAHVLTVCDLDTPNQTCYSEVDSSSREVLQQASATKSSLSNFCRYSFGKNLILDHPLITGQTILNRDKASVDGGSGDDERDDCGFSDNWKSNCLIVNQFGRLESTNYAASQTNDDEEIRSYKSSSCSSSSKKASSSPLPSPTPSSLPTTTTSTTTNQNSTTRKRSSNQKNLLNSLSRLIKNRLLLLRILSGILHILPIAAFFTFLPKYLIEQFRILPSTASTISGLGGILFVGIGAFLGGTIVRVFNVNSRRMTRWIATSALLYSIGMLILMNLGCDQNRVVYHGSPDFLASDCLTRCQCSETVYNPVCVNGTTYISPCLAGCKSFSTNEDRVTFNECGCSRLVNATTSVTASSPSAPDVSDAHQGHCVVPCDNLIWYIITFSAFTLIHASSEVGSMMFNLRCVKSYDRTLALGLNTFSSSLFGAIPCSVIYGTMIDLTCVHWDTLQVADDPSQPVSIGDGSSTSATTTQGACRAYENNMFRYYLHGVTAFVMFMAFIIDYLVSRRAEEVDFYDYGGQDSDKSKRMERAYFNKT